MGNFKMLIIKPLNKKARKNPLLKNDFDCVLDKYEDKFREEK